MTTIIPAATGIPIANPKMSPVSIGGVYEAIGTLVVNRVVLY